MLDSVVLEQAHKNNRKLYIAYIYYRKTFDSVPHRRLICVLEIYKIDPIYQEDSLSPLRFFLALNPLSYLTDRTNYCFSTNSNNQEIQRLRHLLYLDDIKLYVAANKQLQGLLQLTQTFSRDIKMSFGIEKCKTLSISKGKLEMKIFTTENGDTMEVMNEENI
jgi:hypothetical protein